MALAVTPRDITEAHARIERHVRRTPSWALPRGTFGLDLDLHVKLEMFQHAGSFKTRGAFNTLLAQPSLPTSVTAASGGNHGVAVAYAARRLGVPARIFVPEIASPAKLAAIRANGAEVVVGGQRYGDAQDACDRWAAETGTLIVHPYDRPTTIAGAGTVALEWEQDTALDTVLVGCGGGGLAAGLGAWWTRRVRVVAVEPEGSRALHAALEAGRPVDVTVESVAADSLGARAAGTYVLPIAQETIDHVALVTDDAIRAAQRALWLDMRIAVEPGAAAALGALLSGVVRPARDERVGVLLCGANVALSQLAAAVE